MSTDKTALNDDVTPDKDTRLGDESETAAVDPSDETATETAGPADGDESDEGATDVVSDDADDVAPVSAEPVRRRRWGGVLAGVLAALLVASAGLTAWLYFHTYRPDQAVGPAASDAVLQQAKDATVAVLSYSPENLDKDLAAAKSHLTGDFLKYYTQFTDEVVRPAVQTKKVSTTANVVQAAVSEMHPDQAKVLVFVNQTTISADRTEPALAASSVVVTMDKVDGKWLISAFDPV